MLTNRRLVRLPLSGADVFNVVLFSGRSFCSVGSGRYESGNLGVRIRMPMQWQVSGGRQNDCWLGWVGEAGWLGWAPSAWPQNSDKHFCKCDCQIISPAAGNVLVRPIALREVAAHYVGKNAGDPWMM